VLQLQPDKVRREMTVSGGKLVVWVTWHHIFYGPYFRCCFECNDLIPHIYEFRRFEAIEARFLRASFSAFVDLMVLVTKLVEEYSVSNEEHSALWASLVNLWTVVILTTCICPGSSSVKVQLDVLWILNEILLWYGLPFIHKSLWRERTSVALVPHTRFEG
jgi:hypothetical protein